MHSIDTKKADVNGFDCVESEWIGRRCRDHRDSDPIFTYENCPYFEDFLLFHYTFDEK